MKKILLVLAFLAVSCAENSSQQKIKIGLNAEYHPYEYIDGGKYTGFNIDVIETVMADAGLEYELVNMSFDGLLAALQTSKVDMVIGVSVTPERKKSVDYSMHYTFSQNEDQALLAHKENLVDENNLQGKKIGVLLGSMQESILQSLGGIDIVSYNSFTGAVLDLNNKKLDAVLISQKPGAEYLEQNHNLAFSGLVPNNLGGGYAVAVKKGDELDIISTINQSLEKLLSDGTIDSYRDKYKLDELQEG